MIRNNNEVKKAEQGTRDIRPRVAQLRPVEAGWIIFMSIYVINGLTTDYTELCFNNYLLSLHERLRELSQRFSNNCILSSTSCLHYLLPIV